MPSKARASGSGEGGIGEPATVRDPETELLTTRRERVKNDEYDKWKEEKKNENQEWREKRLDTEKTI